MGVNMDITKSDKKIFTNKIFNGETVNYGFIYCLITFAFLLFKQIFKLCFSVNASVAVLISFLIFQVILFFCERKYVFNSFKSKNSTQILLYLFRIAVDFGFYKILHFIFVSVMNIGNSFVFLITWVALFFFNYYFDRLLVFDCRNNPLKKQNGKLYRLFFYNRFIIFSVALSTLGILFIYLVYKLYPFGDTTVMRMDLYHQYGPLFAEFYDRVVEHKSFLYSWESGGGLSFLGNYFNYLSSPLSFLIFLFDRKEISYAITTLVVVKGVLCSATFTYYIKKSLKIHCYASASFGVFYAFCGYFLAYYWNIMWIDGMILLPLITLGIENIINLKSPKLYLASLTLLLFSSYYMGYMCCIFSVVYFIAYYFMNCSLNDKIIANCNFKNRYSFKALLNNKFILCGCKFALYSLLSAALCACTLIPVYFILQSCSATSDSFPTEFKSYFDIFDLLTSHLAGLETTIRSSGDDVLPNIYCGTLTVLLIPVYFVNKDIKLKEKLSYLLLLVFFIFSFNNNCMNFIWHAFHFPNDLPYRFSFMYSFIVLIIALKGLKKIKSLRYTDIAFISILWSIIVMLIQKNPTNKISETSIYITLAFTVIWTGILLLIKKKYATRKVIGIAVAALTFCEVIVADGQSYLFTQNQSDYVARYDSIVEAIENTEKSDDGFYRSELCKLNTRMDSCLYGYNGMSTFSSMAYEEFSGSQYSLGMFGNRINSYTYNTQTPVYNMMYSIKYLMADKEVIQPSDEYYSKYYKTNDENITVYQNDYFLPIAYTVSDEIKNWETPEGNPFSVQEDFINKSAGVNDLFLPVEYLNTEDVDVVSDSLCVENGTQFFSSTGENQSSINITVASKNNSNVYIYVTSPTIENINYSWTDSDGYEKTENQNISEPYIMDLGYHKKGEEITISLDCGNVDDDTSYYEIYAYSIDKDVLDAAYEMLSCGALNISYHTQTEITGTVDAGYDGYLYTSIPYDEGWSVYIDGKKSNIEKIGGYQLATKIEKGTHTVTFKYSPKGKNIGTIISVCAWLVVILIFIYEKKKRKKSPFVDIQ